MLDFEKFLDVVRKAFLEIMLCKDSDPVFEVLTAKRGGFDFFVDGGMDSLDTVDIMFSVGQTLKIRTVSDFQGTTVAEMYQALCECDNAKP